MSDDRGRGDKRRKKFKKMKKGERRKEKSENNSEEEKIKMGRGEKSKMEIIVGEKKDGKRE